MNDLVVGGTVKFAGRSWLVRDMSADYSYLNEKVSNGLMLVMPSIGRADLRLTLEEIKLEPTAKAYDPFDL